MNFTEFEREYAKLPDEKTATIDKFCKRLLKEDVDVSFLRDEVVATGRYYYIYQQVSIKRLAGLDAKFGFIESCFEWMSDWIHTDGIMKFLGDEVEFEYVYEKARRWVADERPYVRRMAYVIFIPRLTKDEAHVEDFLALLENAEHHHVVMAEAWLISFLAMCDVEKVFRYLRDCDLKYNIVGKAIQKICDSFVISEAEKERFKSLRVERKKIV